MLATVALWCMEAQTALLESKLWLPCVKTAKACEKFLEERSHSKFGVTFFGNHRSYMVIHHHTSSSIYPNLRKKKLGPNSTNGDRWPSIRASRSFKKVQVFTKPSEATPGVTLKQASSIWVQPHAHGDPSPAMGPSPTMGRMDKSHAATAWRMEKKKMESGNASGFFSGKCPHDQSLQNEAFWCFLVKWRRASSSMCRQQDSLNPCKVRAISRWNPGNFNASFDQNVSEKWTMKQRSTRLSNGNMKMSLI